MEGSDEGRRPSPPHSPLPQALLTAHCPARQELGETASSSCGLGPDFGVGTGTHSHALPLRETAPAHVRLGLVPAGSINVSFHNYYAIEYPIHVMKFYSVGEIVVLF